MCNMYPAKKRVYFNFPIDDVDDEDDAIKEDADVYLLSGINLRII